ncbi:MAG: OmpH family outer membrane protein [Crocinitomicaceae bacterium]
MKKSIIILIALLTLGSFGAVAQTATFAHVHSIEVFDTIQSFKDLQKEQMEIQKRYADVEKKIYADLEKIQREVEMGGDTLSQIEFALYQDDANNKQLQLQKVQQSTQQSMDILTQRSYKLEEMYRKAVEKVAKAEGVTYVFDADQQVIYASDKGKDLTDKVMQECLKMDAENPVHRYP